MLFKSTKMVNVERGPEGQTLWAPSQHGCLLLFCWLLAEVNWVEEVQPMLVPLISWLKAQLFCCVPLHTGAPPCCRM